MQFRLKDFLANSIKS